MPVRNSLEGRAEASTRSYTKDNAEGDDEEWPWITLADSCISRSPPVLTADRNHFFSISGSAVRIYSAATGKVVSTLSSSSIGSSASLFAIGEGHSDVITAAILNPENPFQLITASLDGNIKIWNYLDAELIRTIRVGNPISHMCAHEKYKGQVFIAVLTKSKNPGRTAVLNKGNTMIYRVSLMPKPSESPHRSKPSEIVRIGKTKAAVSMGISASGSWLVVVAGYKAYVSSNSSPESGFTKFLSPERLTCLAFHPVDDYFATGDEIGQIRLWYCLNNQLSFNTSASEKRAQTTTMHWHAHAVSSLAFTRNGAYLLSGGEESVLVIWQLQTGKREYIPRLGSPITTITVRETLEGEEYLLGLADGSYLFVNPGSLTVSRSISRIRLDPKGMGRPTHTPVPLAAHPKTSTLILPASHPSSLQIFSPSTQALSELEVSSSNRVSRRDEKNIEPARVDFVSVRPSGEWMATIDVRENEEGFSAEVCLKIWSWSSSTWELNSRIDQPHGSKKVVALGFSPLETSELLMTAGHDGSVRTWCSKITSGKGGTTDSFWLSRSVVYFRSEIPSDAHWSPDGSLIAVCFGRQIALYDPYSSFILDHFTVLNAHGISTSRFVGKSGRYLLASGRHDAVLWDLVKRRVSWHYCSNSVIAQALAHPLEDLVTLVIQPFVEDTALRTSQVLFFTPTSSEPFSVKSLPFRFRGVDWYDLDRTNRTIIGFTYSWDVVLCGSEVQKSSEPARSIDGSATAPRKRTLFQDIFGKSAFADIPTAAMSSPAITTTPAETKGDDRKVLAILNVPTYLAPPIDSSYTTLIERFLVRRPEPQPEEILDEEEHEDSNDMAIDTDSRSEIQQGRSVEMPEIDDLVQLFQRQSVNRPSQKPVPNGISNGIGKTHINGVDTTVLSRVSTPNSQHSSTQRDLPAPELVASHISPSPVTAGKKRKKSTS